MTGYSSGLSATSTGAVLAAPGTVTSSTGLFTPVLRAHPLRQHLRRAESMGMPALQLPDFWTAEMVRALPDDGYRYETVHGELLVSPSPRLWHEIVVNRLGQMLSEYLRREPAGMVLYGRADISWGPDVLVEPDVFVAPLAELRTLDWANVRSLLLVSEVVSPSSVRTDRFTKRRLYQEVGIPLHWIVDADAHFVECWTPDAVMPTVERETIIWHPASALSPCSISLEELIRPL